MLDDWNGEGRFFDGSIENGNAEFEVSGDGRREANGVAAVSVVRDAKVDNAAAMIAKLRNYRITTALSITREWEAD